LACTEMGISVRLSRITGNTLRMLVKKCRKRRDLFHLAQVRASMVKFCFVALKLRLLLLHLSQRKNEHG
jgi:hypothetical protein